MSYKYTAHGKLTLRAGAAAYRTGVPAVWHCGCMGDTSHAFEPNFAVAQSDSDRYAFASMNLRRQTLVHRGAINQDFDHLRAPAGIQIFGYRLPCLGRRRVASPRVTSAKNLLRGFVREPGHGELLWMCMLCDLSCPACPVKVKTTHSAPPNAPWCAQFD